MPIQLLLLASGFWNRDHQKRPLRAAIAACVVGALMLCCAMAMPRPVVSANVAHDSHVAVSRAFGRDHSGGSVTDTGDSVLGESNMVDTNLVSAPAAPEAEAAPAEEPATGGATAPAEEPAPEAVPEPVVGARTITPANDGDYGNMYPWGQCTWYSYLRRHQLGLPAGSWFGNAKDWAASAAALGYRVDNTPSAGAILVFQPGQAGADGFYGHVAVVEHVDLAAGVMTISESNVQGLGVISERVLALSAAGAWSYIH